MLRAVEARSEAAYDALGRLGRQFEVLEKRERVWCGVLGGECVGGDECTNVVGQVGGPVEFRLAMCEV